MTISNAVLTSSVARVVGIETKYEDRRAGNILFLPQRIALIGQGSSSLTYPSDPYQATSAIDIGQRYGFGSPLHLAAMQLMPANGDGVGTIPVVCFPLSDAGSATAAEGSITPSGTQNATAEYRINVNNIYSEPFVITSTDTVATVVTNITGAINAIKEMPIIAEDNATEVGITSKWNGASANDIFLTIEGILDGMSFAFTQPTGGAVNPNVEDVFSNFGNVWYSMIVNCLNIEDAVTLDSYQTFGMNRWGALVRKPFVCFTGTTADTVEDIIEQSDNRKDDYINALIPNPASIDLPLKIAARGVAKIALKANSSPASDFGSIKLNGLTPGPVGSEFDYIEKDKCVKGGASTVDVIDGIVTISDIVTFYHPDGDPIPAYRYVCDVIKLQTILYNIDLEFASEKWDGKPLIPDDQPTINPDARQPKAAISSASAIIDNLGLQALISDPETAKTSLRAAINDQNPKRLDMVMSIQLSGNTNIISIDLGFGFYFGQLENIA